MRKLLSVLAAVLLTGCASIADAGYLAEVSVINRSTGERLQVYRHGGRLYVEGKAGERYAVELRNRGWLKPELGEMLSNLGVALVLQDLFYMPKLDWITTDFTVIRWLGRRSDIQKFDRIQIDRSKELTRWADRVRRFLEEGVDVYGYFNNHFAGHSPASVKQFLEILGGEEAGDRK